MNVGRHERILISVCTGCVVCAAGAACGRSDTPRASADTVSRAAVPARSGAGASGGEVNRDSVVAPAGIWIDDANVLALLKLMASQQLAAANVELEAAHLENVQSLAVSVVRDQAALRHAVDSVAAVTRLAPVMPALGRPIGARMQSAIDSLAAHRGIALDRAFVRQQIGSHEFMRDYIARLASVAQRPEVKGVVAAAGERVAAQLGRTRALEATLVVADSAAAADSARVEARRKRRGGTP